MDEIPDLLDAVLACLKQMESNLLGMKQLRGYLSVGVEREMLEAMIAEAEDNISEIKRRMVQGEAA